MLLRHPATVTFDPANKEHRKAVQAFLKRNAWADTPMRFTHDPEFNSVADMVQAKLLAWYMEKDLNRPARTKKNSSGN